MNRFNERRWIGAVIVCTVMAMPSWAQRPKDQARPVYVVRDGGTTVEQLIEKALQSNNSFLASRKQIDEAQGLRIQAGLRPNPTLQTNLSSGPAVGNSGEGEVSVSYSHTFELGRKRDRRVDVATLGVTLTERTVADLERQLRADIKARYVEAISAARNLTTAQELLSVTDQTFRIAEARVEQGEAPALDARLLDVERNRLRSDELLLEGQVKRSVLELKTLAGIEADTELVLHDGSALIAVSIPPAEAIERALKERPDLQAARTGEQKSRAEAELARAEAVPNITGYLGYTNSRSRFPQLGLNPGGGTSRVSDNDNLLGIGISIPLPIRDRNQGNIYAAEARNVQARLRRQFLEQTARREIEAAYNRYQAALRARTLFDDSINRQAEENLKTMRGSYDLGETRLVDVLNEQRRLIETRRAYTEVLREYQLSVVELERLIGNLGN